MRWPMSLMRYFRGALARRLVLGVVLVQAAVLVAFAIDTVSRQSATLNRNRRERTEGIARIVAATAPSWVLSEDTGGLQELVDSARSFSGLRYALVLTPAGRVLAHTDTSKIGGAVSDPVARSLLSGPPRLRTIASTRFAIDVAAPISDRGKLIGWSWVSLTRADVEAAIQAAIWKAVLYTLFGMAAASVFGLLMARNIAAGLKALARVADGFRAGNRDVRFTDRRSDEIGAVGRGVNAMLDAIVESERSLKNTQRIARIGSWRYVLGDARVQWSDEVFEIFGVDPGAPPPLIEEFVALLPPESQALVKDVLDPDHPKHTFEFTLRFVGPGGSERFCWTEGRSEFDAKGRFIAVVGVCQDITARERVAVQIREARDAAEAEVRRRREAEDQLRELNETLEARVEERTRERDRASETATAIFNSTNDGILTLNARGGIETINLAAQRMFGYSAAEVVGRDAAVLLGLSTERPSKGLIDRLGKSWGELEKGVIVELEARRQDGSGFAADLALSAMELGHETHVVAVVRDISDRKRVERLKDEFVATVSHELRTPLTSIAGSLGLLNGGAFGALPEGASKLVRIAHSNCGRLVRLINDILDIEKIGSGKLKLERTEVDVSALVARSVDEVRPCAREAAVDLQLRADEPLTVQGDADRLNQVVTNLLANAIKFSPASGVVEVSVTRTDDTVRVAVRDYGPGIPEDFRSRIFSKFAQADSSDTRGQGGSGLGLSIAKEIVEHHEGRLWFESTPGEGAVFYVDLPHQPAPAAAAVA